MIYSVKNKMKKLLNTCLKKVRVSALFIIMLYSLHTDMNLDIVAEFLTHKKF